MTILKRDQERQDWNQAADIFSRHFPHVPKLTDEDPMMPKQVSEHRKAVISAIMDGIKAGRDHGGQL